MFDSLEALEEPVHYFFVPKPSEKAPFSDEVLKTIVQELAVGIFVHDSVPFFSLHFNREANLYPVIHPVYQNTLVGRVISLLDYHMKGFLHGVFYDEAFIDAWHKNPVADSATLLRNCHDIREYCAQHLPHVTYYSMRELIQKIEFLDGDLSARKDEAEKEKEPKLFSEYSGFRSSFRIIAKQNSFQKTGQVFRLDGGFDVFYTIEPDAIYQAELEKYRTVSGKDPSGYMRLVKAYEIMRHQIETIMPQLPMFRELFEQLKIINFFSYYFKTLKKAQKVPVLEPIHRTRYEGVPLFPHLPVKKFKEERVEIDFEGVLALLPEEALKDLKRCVQQKKVVSIPKPLFAALEKAMETYLQSKISFPLSNDANEVMRRKSMIEAFVVKAEADSEKALQDALQQLPLLEERKKSLEKEVAELEEYKKEKEPRRGFSDVRKILDMIEEALREERPLLEKITKFIADIDAHKTDPFGFFLKAFQIKSRELQSVLEVTKDLPVDEREVQERIVGGCGQNMSSKPLMEMPMGEDFIQNHILLLKDLPEKVFTAIRSSEAARPEGYVFALGVADEVTVSDRAYSYMAHMLPEEEREVYEQFYMLLHAMQEGDEKTFLERVTPNLLSVKDTNGATLVHLAAGAGGSVAFLKIVASCKADFLCIDYFGNTPLHYAAKDGSLDQCAFILDVQKRLLNTVSKNGSSPLYIAVQQNREDMVQRLLAYGADPNCSTVYGMSPLYCAIHNGFESIALKLIKERKTNVNLATEDGNTPIFLAIEMGSLPVVEALIDRGVNILHQRKDGLYPIHVAFLQSDFNMCATIVYAPNSDVNARMRSGKTAVYIALERKDEQLLLLLLSKGADIWVTGYDEESTLMAAIRAHDHYGALHIVKNCRIKTPGRIEELLYKKNAKGEDPLHLALSERQPLCLYVLTDQRIKLPPAAEYVFLMAKNFIDPPYFEGFLFPRKFTPEEFRPAYYEACRVGYLRGSEIMRKNNVSWDFTDENGWTPVHFAAKYGDMGVLKPFLEKKPDNLVQMTKEGLSIAAIAAMYQQVVALKLLAQAMKEEKVDLSRQYYGKHLLLACVQTGNAAVVDALLYITFDAEMAVDDQERTAISYAAMRGDVEMIDLLIRRGAKWLKPDKYGKSAVHYVIENDHEDAIEFFLDPKNEFPLPPNLLLSITSKTDVGLYRRLMKRVSIDVRDDSTGRTPLFEAIRVDNYPIFDLLLRSGASIDHVAKDGLTPFLYAAKLGATSYVERLFKQSFLQTTPDGQNALHIACMEGHVETVFCLLQKNIDRFGVDRNGENPLIIAQKRGFRNIATILEGREEEVQKRIFGVERAIKHGQIEEFFSLIETLPLNLMIPFSNGKMPLLHYIQAHSPTPFVGSVLEQKFLKIPGVDPYVKDVSGKTIYHKKAHEGEEVDFSTVDPLQKDFLGRTILHYCAVCSASKSEKALRQALERVTMVDVEDDEGLTPLLLAIRSGRQDHVEIMLQAKASPNYISTRGLTPLGEAVLRGHVLIASLLLQKGANPNQPILDRHMAPLHVAINKENIELAKLLLASGANPEQGMIQNVRPIHLAAQIGSIPLLKLLKTFGAVFTSKDDRGWTLVHHAALSDNPKLFEFLFANRIWFNEPAVKVADSVRRRHGGITGEVPFHVAAQKGNPMVMRSLFSRGGNNELQADGEISSLVSAAASASKHAVKFFKTFRIMQDEEQLTKATNVAILHDAVESLRILQPDGQKLLKMPFRDKKNAGHLAAENGALRTIFYLHTLGLDFSAKDLEQSTPFFLAVDENKIAVARYFLRNVGVDIHEKTAVGGTFLHSAVYKGYLEMTCLLLIHGASLEQSMPYRGKPLHIALRQENLPMIRLLLSAGAQIDLGCMDVMPKHREICAVVEKYAKLRSATDKLGDTVIHTAIRSGEIQFFQTIVQLDAVDTPNKEGKTPLQLAIELKAKKFIKQLLMHGAALSPDMDVAIQSIFMV